ncbi:hypothetical protein ACP4OV_026263 [Aristida adscensionis]
MRPGPRGHARRRPRRGRGAAGADFAGIGFAAVFTAVSFLLPVFVGGGGGGGWGTTAEWQVILAFALMSGGVLCIAHGMRRRGARPPGFVGRAVDAVGAVLWHAAAPERRVLLLVLLMSPFLEAWFDFI